MWAWLISARLSEFLIPGSFDLWQRLTSSCSRRLQALRGTPHVRHFIMHVRRASCGIAPRLNREVRLRRWGNDVFECGPLRRGC